MTCPQKVMDNRHRHDLDQNNHSGSAAVANLNWLTNAGVWANTNYLAIGRLWRVLWARLSLLLRWYQGELAPPGLSLIHI